MKRALTLILTLVLALSLTACGGNSGSSGADADADADTAGAGADTEDTASGDPVELIVFAAASMQETFTEIGERIGRASCRERV